MTEQPKTATNELAQVHELLREQSRQQAKDAGLPDAVTFDPSTGRLEKS